MIWLTAAFAGFYHPSDVAAASEAFATASEATSGRAQEAQRRVRAMATALNDWEEALDVLGPAAPASERTRHAALVQTHARQLAVLQADVDALVGGFDTAFSAALKRALAAHPEATRCEATIAKGRALPGMPARRERNPDCTGEDLNPTLAALIDADPALRSDLEALRTLPWTEFTLEAEPLDVDGARWIGVTPFLRAVARKPLAAVRRADEEARLAIEARIEEGADPSTLATLKPEAAAITAATARHRAELLAPAFDRAAVVFAKKAPDAAWCPRPVALGGCTGDEDSAALTALLRADRKLVRSLP